MCCFLFDNDAIVPKVQPLDHETDSNRSIYKVLFFVSTFDVFRFFFNIDIVFYPKHSPLVVFFDDGVYVRDPLIVCVCVSFYAYFFFLRTFFSDQIFPPPPSASLSSSSSEHLASIFGTEKDRVNCPFYFKVRRTKRHIVSRRRSLFCVLVFSKVETDRSRNRIAMMGN